MIGIGIEDIIDPMIMHGFEPTLKGAFIDYDNRRCSPCGALAYLNMDLEGTDRIALAYGVSDEYIRGIEAGWRGWTSLLAGAEVHGMLDFILGYDLGEQALRAYYN